MKRNNSIEAFRFLFICVICLWHFNGVTTFIKHGYIAVEFFFIVSGFYLYRAYKKHSDIGTLDYTLHKVKKFLPPFIISFVLLLLLDREQYIYPPSNITPDAVLSKYFVHLHELFFCQGIGFTDRVAVNHPLWFISILLFSGGILYSLLRNYNQKAISLIIPVLTVLGFNYMLMNGNHSLAPFCSSFIPGLNTGIVRGITEMGLGILTAYIFERKIDTISQHIRVINMGGVISATGYVLMIFANDNYDYLALVFIPIIIISCNLPDSLFQKKLSWGIFGWLGSLSMYMYFIHLFVAYIFWIWLNHFGTPNIILVVAYLISVIIVSYTLKILSDKFSSLLSPK